MRLAVDLCSGKSGDFMMQDTSFQGAGSVSLLDDE